MWVRKNFHQLPSTFLAAGRPTPTSVNFLPAGRPTPTSVNFSCAHRPSAKFRQFSVQQSNHPSTSVNFSCGQKTFCQHFLQPGDFLSTFVKFTYVGRPSIKFCQLFVSPGDLLSISDKFLCSHKTFHHLLLRPETSVNFRQLSMRPKSFPKFHQLFL